MDHEIVWSGPALAELGNLLAKIAEDKPDAARKVGDRIFKHVRILAAFPQIGPVYRGEESGVVRQITYKRYRLFYQIDEVANRVEILTIRHGAREEPDRFS